MRSPDPRNFRPAFCGLLGESTRTRLIKDCGPFTVRAPSTTRRRRLTDSETEMRTDLARVVLVVRKGGRSAKARRRRYKVGLSTQQGIVVVVADTHIPVDRPARLG